MLPSLCIRVSVQYPTRYGIALRFSEGQFDRPFVKCYKSMLCAALASRLRGASPAIFGYTG